MKRFGMAAMVMALVISGISAQVCQAAALTDSRDTPTREGKRYSFLQGSNIIYAGSMVAVNSSQVAAPASDTTALKVVGRAAATQDNTGTAYSATRSINVDCGIFRWANGPTFTLANVGDLAYAADDQTVTSAGNVTYDVIAGVIVDVDSSGVWVDTYDIGSQGAASVTTLAASGAVALSSTLSVAGAATLTGNAIANEVDARTATALLLGKATATSVTLGASDANTTVAGQLTVTLPATCSSNLTVNGATIIFSALPTATNGLATGTLWLSGTNLCVK